MKIKWKSVFLFSPEAPVDGDVFIKQDIGQTSFGAILCDDADVGNFDRTTNELA